MHEVPDLIACECCDALHQRAPLAAGEIARCRRCGNELERLPSPGTDRMLPLTLAALILFVLANVFPIVEIEVQGLHSQTTLLGAALVLSGEGMVPVAMLVLTTTLLVPLVVITGLFYLLLPFAPDPSRPHAAWLLRGIRSARPWGMIEVFLLGVLIAIVKLGDMATVIPGVAIWAYVGLTVLLTIVVGFDPRALWLPAEREGHPQEARR
ncbi:MAG: paraquat-inducible protein A [Lautropia sp.]